MHPSTHKIGERNGKSGMANKSSTKSENTVVTDLDGPKRKHPDCSKYEAMHKTYTVVLEWLVALADGSKRTP